MTTSVKLNDRDKEKLERLQALVTLRTGEKITQQELLRILIGEALLKGDGFFDKISEQKLPMSDEEYERILSLVDDWRVETSWEDVDQILYGAKSRRRQDLDQYIRGFKHLHCIREQERQRPSTKPRTHG